MLPFDALVDRTQIARVATGLYNVQIGTETMDWALDALASGTYASVADIANYVYAKDFGHMANTTVASMIVTNLKITGAAQVAEALAVANMWLDGAAPAGRGAAALELMNLFSGLTLPQYAEAVDAFNATVDASIHYSARDGYADLINYDGRTLTLGMTLVPAEAAVPDVVAIYWGYKPTGTDGEFDPDEGVPVAELLSFLQTITGLDLFELGLIDDDGVGPFDNVTNLTLSNVFGDIENEDGGDLTLEISFADGTTRTVEADLGEAYFDFLSNLLYDADGNSRLFEKVLVDGTSASEAYWDYLPIVLTPSQYSAVLQTGFVNGGNYENGVTTAGDDVIVAGRLELLHGAYIDGGLGYNILEVDAKGVFAQPIQLLNIQEVRINNLPNVYTYEDGDSIDDDYPWWDDAEIDPAYLNSMIDLSRATSIERLVITEGSFDGFVNKDSPGSITVAGIRNGAVARLEGGFTQDVNLHWGQGLTGPITVELLIGQITGRLNFAHNTDALNLVSLGGVANTFGSEDLGGRLTNLTISGDAALHIGGDLDDSFHDNFPILIDASANTGGVTLQLSGSQVVNFIGSQGNDVFRVTTAETPEGGTTDLFNDEVVTITGGAGNNYYEVIGADKVTITNGDGNNNYEIKRDGGTSTDLVTITAGDGDNHLEIDQVSTAVLTVGDGDNTFDITSVNSYDYLVGGSVGYKSDVTIVAGDGANSMDIDADANIGMVTVTAGDGGNAVSVEAATISVTSGAGADDIRAAGRDITINAGGSGNSITLVGTDDDYTNDSYGALIQIDAGTNSVVHLGSGNDPQSSANDGFPGTGSLTAKEGSSITGTNLTLFVDTVADLRAASLSGISQIILDDDSLSYGNSNPSNTAGDKALLTLLDTQMTQMVTDGVSISVEGSIFHTSAHIKIIVTANLDVTTGAWATLLSSLPASVDFQFEINDGATLKISAQQLHTKVAVGGISIADDGNTDQVSGKVWVTGAGLDFDPFNNNDQVRTSIDGRDLQGGSLGTGAFGFATDLDTPANGIQRDEWGFNVLVDRTINGYNRPADAPSYSRLTIDTDVQGGELGPFATIETFLRIVGAADMEFTPMQGGIDEWGRPIQGGTAIALGVDNGEPTNTFMVDFSSATGDITNLTFAHFQMADAMYGNGTSENPARVNVQIDEDEAVASAEAGFVSRGVQTYVATAIEGEVEFWTSRVTQDLETLGLRGNYDDTITFGNTERGVDFLMEVTYDKFDGYAVGTVVADFARADADAVFNIVGLQSLPSGEVQKVAGIDVTDADSLSITVTGGNTRIESLVGDDVESLTLAADANLTIATDLMEAVESVDASGVVGTLTMTIAEPADGLEFVGAEGATRLTIENAEAGAIESISGEGAITLTIGDGDGGGVVDLTETTLSNVTSVRLRDGSTLELTVAQMNAIGAENFTIASGDSATLNLVGLDGEPFALDDFANGIDVEVMTIAALPEVTLHPDTDLSGIAELRVPEGTTLNLTAAQFQQLTGAGIISGFNAAGASTNYTVNITGLTQDDAEFDDSDLPDGTEGLDLSGVTARNATITMAEDIELVVGDDLGSFDVVMGDGMTLTLARIEQADGLDIGGGADTTLKFADATNGGSIDASGFTVTTLMALNLLVAGQNIDDIFTGLAESVLKVIYNGEGWVIGVNQIVTIEAGTTVPGTLAVFKTEDDVEVQTLTLNLLGGTEISGDLNLANTAKEEGGNNLIVTHLRSLTINSSGTAPNLLSGETDNVITGDITSQPFGPDADSVENNLLDVAINATQGLDIQGSVIFNSVTGDDDVTGNDDDEAVAELTVNGTADVSIGGLDTSDADVVALNVVNNSTGTLTITLNDGEIDADDELSFTGTGDIVLVISEDSVIDLSNDDLSGVTAIVLEDNAEIILTQAQFEAIGNENISHADFDDTGDEALISIVGLGEDPFDATDLDDGIVIGTVTLAAGDITLDPTTNLTGVQQIIVPEGGTLTLTAAQFQQLAGSGTITGVDADGNPSTEYTVNITGLRQADVNLNAPPAPFAATDGFKLTGVTADDITVTLGEASVTLGRVVNGVLTAGSASELNGAAVILADNQTLQLVNQTQADGLDVSGGTNTNLVFLFDDAGVVQIDASNYDVTFLRALNTFVDGRNVEDILFELDSGVTLVVYASPADMGFVSATNRLVIIEPDVVVPGFIVFNDLAPGREVLTLTVTMQGDAEIDGDLELSTVPNDPALIPRYFQTLVINSLGDGPNAISGDITALPANTGGAAIENNMLNVIFNATTDFSVGGAVIFTSVDDEDFPDAAFTVNGTGDVTVEQLEVTDADVDTLLVTNNSTGTLTVTGASPGGNFTALENLEFAGAGDIVFGDMNMTTSETGIDGGGVLSSIDASEMTGDLNLGQVTGIDSADFSFDAGTGVTHMMLTGTTLDSTGDDGLFDADDPDAAVNDDNTAGWSFDFTGAAAGSALHFGPGLTFVDGSVLNINMGANGTLYIDQTMDLSDLDLSILGVNAIVLKDEVVLTLTAAQADGLTIIAGPDSDNDDNLGRVDIFGLGSSVVDLSGIPEDIAGNVYLGADDVTLAAATNLGFFTVVLEDIDGDSTSLAGQTIRFATVAQAERDVLVIPDTAPAGDSSTNVVWLFTDIAAPVDTSGYSPALGRLWFTEDLVTNEGGLIENLFTTLPSTILRVDFSDVTELEILLASLAVDRTLELVNFTQLNNLTFSDIGEDPEEHIENLTIKAGGQVVVGNILIDDVVAAPDTDVSTINFQTLTIESHRALSDLHFLASEFYVNDNDGINETGEMIQPANINTFGNIGVGAENGLNLLDVQLDTLGVSTVGTGLAGSVGAALRVGTITYGYEPTATDPTETALLGLSGANNITVTAVNTSDVDITGLTVDVTGFTAVFAALGASPAFILDNTETLTFTSTGVDTATVNLGNDDPVNAGIAGNELSFIDASGMEGDLNLGIIAQIDSSNDDRNDDGDTEDAGDEAFTFTSGTGVTTLTLAAANGRTPTLNTDSTWVFDFSAADGDSTMTIDDSTVFQDDSNLVLIGVNLVISGDVDLSEVNLSLVSAPTPVTINVPEGMSLTLSVDQLFQGDMVDITGSGTVRVVGDASNLALGAHLRTIGVDISGVTIITDDLVIGNDLDDTVELTLTSALDDEGDAAGHVVTGSDFDDAITTGAEDDVISGGEGDDTLTGGAGVNTFDVDADTDTINDLKDGDILLVTAGATAIAVLTGDFEATAESVNNGTAIITGAAGDDTIIDVSAATGNGSWQISGGEGNLLGGDVLIGSAGADVINGGNSEQESAASVDSLTGNGGADRFHFNVAISAPTQPVVATTIAGIDREEIVVTPDLVADDDDETITITYVLNGVASAIIIDNDPALDVMDEEDVADAIAAVLNGINGISASATGDTVTARGVGSNSLDFVGGAATIGGTDDALTVTYQNGTDVQQSSDITIAAGVVTGEKYTILVTLAEGQIIGIEYTAVAGDDEADVAFGLATAFNTVAPAATVLASNAGGVVTLLDEDADDGGFTVTSAGGGAVTGSGASVLLSVVLPPATFADAFADVIEDFTASDRVSFDGMAAGVAGNYREAAETADFATALADANTQFNGSIVYYLTSTADDGGLLFFDANADGNADGVVNLVGIDETMFSASNIVAG